MMHLALASAFVIAAFGLPTIGAAIVLFFGVRGEHRAAAGLHR